MEGLKMQRKYTRASFTKCYNTLLEELYKSEPDSKVINVSMVTLERLLSELIKFDEQIVTLFLNKGDDKKYEEEYMSIETFKIKFDMARSNVNEYLSDITKERDKNKDCCQSPSSSGRKLKKIELRRFGGDVKDWLSFWNQFKEIHDDEELRVEDKFQYLIQGLLVDSKAIDIVNSFPRTDENYEKVINVLKNRFGREDILTEYYVREIVGLVIKNRHTWKGTTNITQLYNKLESHLKALESIGVTQNKHAAMLFPLVESSLPKELLRAWIRSPFHKEAEDEEVETQTDYNKRLQQLLSFLRCEVEGEEKINVVKSESKGEGNRPRSKKKRCNQCSRENDSKCTNKGTKSNGSRKSRRYKKWKKISTWLMLLLLGID